MSALRQRMVDAIQVRGLSARTIECYTESIAHLSRHLSTAAHQRPDTSHSSQEMRCKGFSAQKSGGKPWA